MVALDTIIRPLALLSIFCLSPQIRGMMGKKVDERDRDARLFAYTFIAIGYTVTTIVFPEFPLLNILVWMAAGLYVGVSYYNSSS